MRKYLIILSIFFLCGHVWAADGDIVYEPYQGMFKNPQYPDKECADQGTSDGSNNCVQDIITAFPSEMATIVFQHDGVSTYTDYDFTTNETIPGNLAIIMEPGARLAITTGDTVTISGDFQAVPSLQCIDGTGTGNVSFDIATDEPAGDTSANAPMVVYLEWWGADGDPTTDDHVAMEQATVALGNATYGGGGIIQLIRGRLYLFDDTVTNQKWQVLQGNTTPSHLGGWNKANDTSLQKGGIYINTNDWIEARGTIRRVNLYRKGLTGKEATAGSFAGTAIKITSGNHDVTIEDTVILGFAQAIISVDAGRGFFNRVYGDTIDGIDVSGSADVTRINDCHFYPWLTSHLGLGNANLQRAGTAFYFHAQVDWGIIHNSFSFGYETSVELHNVHGVTVSNHGADQDGTQNPASRGAYQISGTTDSGDLTKGNTITNSRGAGHAFGIWVSQTGDSQPHVFTGNTLWSMDNYGILLQGDVNATITGNNLWQASTGGTGIYINDAQAHVTITGNIFENWTTDIIDASSADVTISQNMAEDGPVWADRLGSWATTSQVRGTSGTIISGTATTDMFISAYIFADNANATTNYIAVQTPSGTTIAIDGYTHPASNYACASSLVKKSSTYAVVFNSSGADDQTTVVTWTIPLY